MEETGCEVICGAPTALMVKGQMMGEEDYFDTPDTQTGVQHHTVTLE